MRLGNSPQGIYSDNGLTLLGLLGPDGTEFPLYSGGPQEVTLLPGVGNAAANSAAIQAALNGGGIVGLFANGPIYLAVMAELPNHTTVVLGDGLDLRQSTNVPFTYFTNSYYNSSPLSVSSITAAIVATSNGLASKRVQVSVTYAQTPDVLAGDGILIKGDTTNNYNGIWEVGAVSGDVVTFFMSLGNNNASPAQAAGTLTATRSNINCRITGRGKLNGQYNSGNKTAAGNWNDYGIMWNNCLNPWVDTGVKIYDTAKGGIVAASCQSAVSRNLEFNLNTSADCVHYYGPMFGYPEIDGLTGTSGDDGGVFQTIDTTGYTQYMPPNAGGSFYSGGKISRVHLHHGGNSAGAILYPAGGLTSDLGYRMFGTYIIDDVQEALKNTVAESSYMNNHSGFSIGAGYVPQNGGVETIIASNIVGNIQLSNSGGGTITCGSITINNHANPSSGDLSGLSIGDNMTIGKLTIIDPNFTCPAGVNTTYISFGDTTFNVGSLSIVRPTLSNVGTGTSYNLIGGFTANGGTLGSVVIDTPNLGAHCYLLNIGSYAPSGTVPVTIRDAYNLPNTNYPLTIATGSWDIKLFGGSASGSVCNFFGSDNIDFSWSGFSNTGNALFVNVESNLTLINPENYSPTQRVTPVSGASIGLYNKAGYQRMIVAPAATIAALTLDLPANPINGEVLEMTFTQNVTALTLSGGTMTGVGAGVPGGFGGKWIYSAADSTWLMFS